MVRQPITLSPPVLSQAGLKPAYHHGQPVKRVRAIDQSTRPFIAWDGEGVNVDGDGKPQAYVLFGCTAMEPINHPEGLTTFECLDYILSVGEANPTAVHVGFGLTYDMNMIVATWAPTTLARLHKYGHVRVTRRTTGAVYTVTIARGKYFRVTRYKPEYHPKHNTTAKITVQVFDIFAFFMASFIKACKKMRIPVPVEVETGKGNRPHFTIADFPDILKYWRIEIAMLKVLAEKLRENVFGAGFLIRQWYGPGAIANYVLKQHGVKQHMAPTGDEVSEAARYAYAGGRFERFLIGRVCGPVYGIDINSAYPYAISQLPSLAEGTWTHVARPEKLTRFGVYRIRMRSADLFTHNPAPLFHRDKEHNITFPWTTDGWYWSPEAEIARRMGAQIIEGYEYRGAKTRPFAFISEMYDLRQLWKSVGNSAEMSLKLAMNSCYGKLAQRLGWDPVRRRIPGFHQLEWAGWVTSFTRATLYSVMSRIPPSRLVACETDGIYTTVNPADLGITASTELGGWSVDEYQEVMYVQSGLAWLRDSEGVWTDKRRGLDPCRRGHTAEGCECEDVFSLNACRTYLGSLHAMPERSHPWPVYKGRTTRFTGLGTALASRKFSERHCVWTTDPREIAPGATGKRAHTTHSCRACDAGATAYEMAHETVIRSAAWLNPACYPHDIPWIEDTESGYARWRDYSESENGDVTLQYV